MQKLRVKICGLTKVDQALAIAQMGADALGFICVPESPRYIAPDAIGVIVAALPEVTLRGGTLAKIGVFADASLDQIVATVEEGHLTGVQLHGQESPAFCRDLRRLLPEVELIKALRVRAAETLVQAKAYASEVDTLLLDAFTAKALGGTGETWDWALVGQFEGDHPWFLAGGLTPHNVSGAIAQAHPTGIDVSSGVETAPGDKNLALVQQLFKALPLYGDG
jgi:phosphoribosylanthranilate isomerase